jgi:hypothetical protein
LTRVGDRLKWLLAVGYWLLAVGCWLLAVGCWLLAVGCWLLAVGCWLLAVRCSGCSNPCLSCRPQLPEAPMLQISNSSGVRLSLESLQLATTNTRCNTDVPEPSTLNLQTFNLEPFELE